MRISPVFALTLTGLAVHAAPTAAPPARGSDVAKGDVGVVNSLASDYFQATGDVTDAAPVARQVVNIGAGRGTSRGTRATVRGTVRGGGRGGGRGGSRGAVLGGLGGPLISLGVTAGAAGLASVGAIGVVGIKVAGSIGKDTVRATAGIDHAVAGTVKGDGENSPPASRDTSNGPTNAS